MVYSVKENNLTVVFDLGGVLIDWNPRHLYRKLYMGDEAAMEKFLSEICTQEWNMQQDAGRTWAEAVTVLKAEYPRHADMIDAFHLRWHEMIGGQIDDTVAILQELRKRDVPLYALTNWSQETFFDTVNRFDFLSWFRGIVVSGAEKLIKPDPRIFQLLLDRYGLAAEHVVYIDDSPSNVEAAAALGMHGIHFVCADTLGAELANLGLLPNQTGKALSSENSMP
jgi:2-haloacid dehalogenase